MKTRFLQIISLVLLLVLALTACSGTVDPVDNGSEANTTEAPATEATNNNDVLIEKPEKEIKNILMIGNSFCSYYPEELYGIAKAAGYDINVANLYESGCPVKDHWTWLNDHSRNYTLSVTSSQYKGTKKQVKVTDSNGKKQGLSERTLTTKRTAHKKDAEDKAHHRENYRNRGRKNKVYKDRKQLKPLFKSVALTAKKDLSRARYAKDGGKHEGYCCKNEKYHRKNGFHPMRRALYDFLITHYRVPLFFYIINEGIF